MDYFQGVVAEYLRANRQTFVNPEFHIQLNKDEKMPAKGTSWIVDLLAVNFRKHTVHLCEVTYSQSLNALLKRLTAWSKNWPEMLDALRRDASLPSDWPVRPWIFIPKSLIGKFVDKFREEIPDFPVVPLITPLEMALPWKFCTWDREGEKPKTGYKIPNEMQE